MGLVTMHLYWVNRPSSSCGLFYQWYSGLAMGLQANLGGFKVQPYERPVFQWAWYWVTSVWSTMYVNSSLHLGLYTNTTKLNIWTRFSTIENNWNVEAFCNWGLFCEANYWPRHNVTSKLVYSFLCFPAKSTSLTLRKVQKELTEVVDWFPLGVQLGLKVSTLEQFRMDYPNDAQLCKIKVLDWWLRNAKDCSWETLAEVLETMEYEALAENLRRKMQEG